MKKIKLNLRELQVDSFETMQPKSKTGTVKANAPETWHHCTGNEVETCNLDICNQTEFHTCRLSCYGSLCSNVGNLCCPV